MSITVTTDNGRRIAHGFTSKAQAIRHAVKISKEKTFSTFHVVTGLGVAASYKKGKRVRITPTRWL